MRFSDMANLTVRFGAVVNLTVRFGAVFRYGKPYGAVRCCGESYGAVRCGSPLDAFCYGTRRENRIKPCLPYGAPYE